MNNSIHNVPIPVNDPILDYAPGSPEKAAVLNAYEKMYNSTIEIPLKIDGKEVKTSEKASMAPPPIITNIFWDIITKRKRNILRMLSPVV